MHASSPSVNGKTVDYGYNLVLYSVSDALTKPTQSNALLSLAHTSGHSKGVIVLAFSERLARKARTSCSTVSSLAPRPLLLLTFSVVLVQESQSDVKDLNEPVCKLRVRRPEVCLSYK